MDKVRWNEDDVPLKNETRDSCRCMTFLANDFFHFSCLTLSFLSVFIQVVSYLCIVCSIYYRKLYSSGSGQTGG